MTYIKHIVLALAMATAAAETPKLRGRVLEEETPSETVPNRVIGPDETTANKGLIGVDEVPAQIGALVEGVLVPFIGSFPGLETPIVVRYTSLIDAVSWNCIATYSDSYLDALTKERPKLSTPVAFHDTPTRIACVLSAQYTFASAFLPAAAPGIAAAAANRGLVLPETLDPRIVACGADPTKQKAREPEGFEVDEQCLAGVVANSYDPVVVGQAVAEQVLAYAVKDGWNQLGDVGTDGKDCTANCRPFRDTTGYKPLNEPFRKGGPYYEEKGLNRDYLEGNCSRPLACRPVPWRPLSEDDGNGFFVLHQHVTPHIGTQGKTRFLSTEEKDARRAPAPVYNYDIESELVLDRLRLLDDQKKMEVEWFDAV